MSKHRHIWRFTRWEYSDNGREVTLIEVCSHPLRDACGVTRLMKEVHSCISVSLKNVNGIFLERDGTPGDYRHFEERLASSMTAEARGQRV